MPDALLATVGSLTTGALAALWLLTAGYALQSGARRLHRQEDPVPRLLPGMREPTAEEAAELVRRQRALEEAAEAWLSPAHREARLALCTYAAHLADDRVPLSRLADVMGVRKQRAHQQVVAGRAVAVR